MGRRPDRRGDWHWSWQCETLGSPRTKFGPPMHAHRLLFSLVGLRTDKRRHRPAARATIDGCGGRRARAARGRTWTRACFWLVGAEGGRVRVWLGPKCVFGWARRWTRACLVPEVIARSRENCAPRTMNSIQFNSAILFCRGRPTAGHAGQRKGRGDCQAQVKTRATPSLTGSTLPSGSAACLAVGRW